MSRVLAVLGACLVLLGLPGGAAGNQVIKATDHFLDLQCQGITTPLGVAEFAVYSEVAPDGAQAPGFPSLLVWAGEPWVGDPVFSTGLGDAVVTSVSGSVTIAIPLLPAGTATVVGTLTETGTSTSDSELRYGNAWYRDSAEYTQFAFTGTLSLPGLDQPVPFGPDGCGAVQTRMERFLTDPHAEVQRRELWRLSYCQLANAEGSDGWVWVELFDEGGVSLRGRASSMAGASMEFFGDGSTQADGSATFDLLQFDLVSFEELPPGTAAITVSDSGQTLNYATRMSNQFLKARGSVLDVQGRLTTSIGTFDLEGCRVAAGEYVVVNAPSNGPKPGGKVPENDLPSGAVSLAPGDRDVVATRGAQQPGEVSFVCDSIFGPLLLEPQHTVWYTITGTGSAVTVDTAGSDFFSFVSVFAHSSDGPLVAGCETTVPTLENTVQDAQRFDTAPGVTYWVQVGGFDFVPGNVPYGLLKVAVR